MIVDLHGHYAMHLMDEHHYSLAKVLAWFRSAPGPSPYRGARAGKRRRHRDERHRYRGPRRFRALFLWLFRWINAGFNYRSTTSGPGVTLELMKKGRVGVVLSPLLDPLNEFGAIPMWVVSVASVAAGTVLAFLAATLLFYCSHKAALGGHIAVAIWLQLRSLRMLCMAGVMFLGLVALLAAFACYNSLASILGSSLDELPGSPPRRAYFHDLRRQLEFVEEDIQAVGEWACVAHDITELDKAIDAKRIAIIHCVEGGFQLGVSEEAIKKNVARLANRGVAYVTLAHLFWRNVATNAPSLPFLRDGMHDFLIRQPKQGLTPLGRAAVAAMFCNGILIDVTHMSQQAIDDTFALLEQLEGEYGGPPVPVIASHIACHFGNYKYNLSRDTIERIGERKGIMGVIFCDHWMHDGPRKHDPRTARRTFQIVRENIDRIEEVTESRHHCAAIGSDLDGFIKPMLPGLEDMGCMQHLQRWLFKEYPRRAAQRILCGNALRVLRSAWRKPRCKAKQATC
jgi:microsomal dipeptidase-like Zn-dependent dipeptidase